MSKASRPGSTSGRRKAWSGWIGAFAGLLALLIGGMSLVDLRNPPDLLLFIGRFHPLIVHLPIALLLLAGVLELIALAWGGWGARRARRIGAASGIMLLIGAASAVAAVVAGYLLSLEGGYDQALVSTHRALGIAVAVGAVAATGLKTRGRHWKSPLRVRIYAGVLLATVAAVVLASQRGAELTHGSGYLTYYLPAPLREIVGVAEARAARGAITNIDSAYVYADLVAPVLESRCVSCHNPRKEKGGLRLDTAEGLLKGGNGGSPIVAGVPGESDLYRRITLPPGHEDAMPPDGAAPLSIGETELVRWWILNGASVETQVAGIAEIPSSVETLFRRIAPPREEIRRGVYAHVVDSPDPAAVAALRTAGFGLNPIAQDVSLLQVTTVNLRESLGDAEMRQLIPVAEQVAWLDLGRTQVGDEGLATLTQMPHLMRLHLHRTRVTDDGLRHLETLQGLEYLNLYGTDVSDEGLKYLERLGNLKALYLWRTRVTEQGAARLRESLPDAEVVLGSSGAP